MHRIRIALAAAVLGFLTLSAHAAVDSPVRRAFNVGVGGTLYLDTDVGNVHVVPGAGGVVVSIKRHARSQKELDRVHLTMEQRSEEHTSELQSLAYLVCRLLLEKKNSLKPSAKHTCRSCRS